MPLMATDGETRAPVARLRSMSAHTRVCRVVGVGVGVGADTCKCAEGGAGGGGARKQMTFCLGNRRREQATLQSSAL